VGTSEVTPRRRGEPEIPPDRRGQPMPAEGSEQRLLRSAQANARDRSTVVGELALRPGFSSQSPVATDGVFCVTRREAWVTGFDCGVGCCARRALPHRPGGLVPIWLNALGFSPSSLRAVPTEGREGEDYDAHGAGFGGA
jgi:hypothetical protein